MGEHHHHVQMEMENGDDDAVVVSRSVHGGALESTTSDDGLLFQENRTFGDVRENKSLDELVYDGHDRDLANRLNMEIVIYSDDLHLCDGVVYGRN